VTDQDSGPFRPHAWPLELARKTLRFLRLQRVKYRTRAHFVHGAAISFARGADIRPPHSVEFGHHISFGKNFTCEVDVKIGNYVLVSSNVSFIGRDHPFEDRTLTVYAAERNDESVIEIGDDVLIGFGTIVVGTTRIGDGCIVGAGSVVVHDLPPYTVCAGVPARVIRPRFRESD
jgi:acetyltransferase-like isoleucine patch superfamily enzyme